MLVKQHNEGERSFMLVKQNNEGERSFLLVKQHDGRTFIYVS